MTTLNNAAVSELDRVPEAGILVPKRLLKLERLTALPCRALTKEESAGRAFVKTVKLKLGSPVRSKRTLRSEALGETPETIVVPKALLKADRRAEFVIRADKRDPALGRI